MEIPRFYIHESLGPFSEPATPLIHDTVEYKDQQGARYVGFDREVLLDSRSVIYLAPGPHEEHLLERVDDDLFKLPRNAISVESMANENRYANSHPSVENIWSSVGKALALLPPEHFTLNAKLDQLIVDKDSGKVLFLPTLHVVEVSPENISDHITTETQNLADNAVPTPRNPRAAIKHDRILSRLRAASGEI